MKAPYPTDNDPADVRPPQWAERFFAWYCNPILQEEIQGDLYELFYYHLDRIGKHRAKLWYILNVFLFINRHTLNRKSTINHPLISPDMLKNYLKLGFRNILKNRLSAFINAFGLALAIGCCLVVFKFSSWYFVRDTAHANRESIFVVERIVNEDGRQQLYGTSPAPLGPALKNDLPQVIDQSRFTHGDGIFAFEDQVFHEWVTFVDGSFYDIFDFPLKWGNPAQFTQPNAVVLGEAASEKYFGSKDPVGKDITIRFATGEEEKEIAFTVQGVLDKIPDNSTFQFNILLPYEARKSIYAEVNPDWNNHANATFLLLQDSEEAPLLTRQMNPYLAQYNEKNQAWETAAFHLQPLTGMLQHSVDVARSTFDGSAIQGLILLLSIVAILLSLACFNYMNIAVASASTRIKEIGVRKVVGGVRAQIIIQFLIENALLCTIAAGIGLLLAKFIFLPWFNSVGDLNFIFEINPLKDPVLLLFLIGMIVLTTLGGTAYPAFYLSSFKPVTVLKNKIKFGGKNRFRKILLGLQFFLSFLAIFYAIAFLAIAKEANQKHWGYNPEGLINIRLTAQESFEALTASMRTIPDVQLVTGSIHTPGISAEELAVQHNGQDYPVRGLQVGQNYMEVLGLEMINGRSFNGVALGDYDNSIIINETFKKRLAWNDALGQKLTIDDKEYQVIGTVRDFYQEAFDQELAPMVLRLAPDSLLTSLVLKTNSEDLSAVTLAASNQWKQLYPQLPFRHFYQDGVFHRYFLTVSQIGKVLSATAFLTIIISIIGLFGLSMLILSRKMKELSVRKVLGANLLELSFQVNKDFVWTITIAIIIGIPLGYILLKQISDMLYPEASMPITSFGIAIISLLVMTLLSVSKHIYTLAMSNPSNHLRDE